MIIDQIVMMKWQYECFNLLHKVVVISNVFKVMGNLFRILATEKGYFPSLYFVLGIILGRCKTFVWQQHL